VEEIKAAVLAAAMMQPDTGTKRRAEDGDEEKVTKKKSVSQGVKALEKVSKKGMKDVRSFFKKGAVREKVQG
jgi:hypothetical protein